MKCFFLPSGLALSVTAMMLSGCGSMQNLEQTREDTRAVGLLVKSVSNNVETYQKQRDAIASAALRNRQALETLAMEYEARSAAEVAVWEVIGDSKRKDLFTRVHTQANALTAANDQRAARKAEQETELAKARSAVNANTAKLAETSVSLIKLGEAKSAKDEASFFLQFAKQAQAEIATTGEAAEAATDASNEKTTDAKSAKGAQ